MLSLPRFFRDRRGVAAVEFAFVAPVLILIYMGLAEVTMALMAERRAGHATAAIADLIAQDTLTSKTEIDDIFAIGDKIVAPFASEGLTLRVTAIQADNNGTPKVVWSRGKGALGGLAKGRSSSFGMNRQCRRAGAFALGWGLRPYWRYIHTSKNCADGPSRGHRIGVAPKEPRRGPRFTR